MGYLQYLFSLTVSFSFARKKLTLTDRWLSGSLGTLAMTNNFFTVLFTFFSALLLLTPVAKADMTKEFEALEQARVLLVAVKDEASAIAAAKEIIDIFEKIRPQYKEHNDKVLAELYDRQNIINRIMISLSKEKYFESSGLAEAWANIVDPQSRRDTIRFKGRR